MTATEQDEPRWIASPRVILTEMPDGTGLLLHLDTKFYFTLNATGVFVWKQLAEGGSFALLVEELTRRFEVDLDAARQDTTALLEELRREGLVSATAHVK